MVEGGDFVNLGHRHFHLCRKPDQMRGRETAEAILDLVQVFDQQVAASSCVAEQGANLLARLRIDSSTLGCSSHARAFAFRWDFDSHQDVVPASNGVNAHVIIRLTAVMYVEFLGIPRERAGVSELEIEAKTLGQLLGTLARQCPALGELIAEDRLHPSLAANLNGDAFVSDPETALSRDDRVLILSADAGG